MTDRGPRLAAEQLAASAMGASMLRLSDVAKLLGIGDSTAKHWRAEGKLPPADFAMGGIVRWRASTIERWIVSNRERTSLLHERL